MKKIIALCILVMLAVATTAFTQSFSVQLGDRRGPVQPIKFSHQIHAGKLQMQCLYCHAGAEKSPIANLPAVGTCMGCHKIAVSDRPEIQKLASYWERNQPVEWAEVYRLPDHVKFNHKRHVLKGIQCQECHGPVQEMTVVYPYPSMKMGWCVGCHRQHENDPQNPASTDCLVCHH
jgi:hypothetical protein